MSSQLVRKKMEGQVHPKVFYLYFSIFFWIQRTRESVFFYEAINFGKGSSQGFWPQEFLPTGNVALQTEGLGYWKCCSISICQANPDPGLFFYGRPRPAKNRNILCASETENDFLLSLFIQFQGQLPFIVYIFLIVSSPVAC